MTRTRVIGLGFLCIAASIGAAAPESGPEPAEIRSNGWFAREPIDWLPADGAVWASIGHSAAVLCIQPLDSAGKPQPSAQGAAGLLLSFCRVIAFDPQTKAPAQVQVVAEERIVPQRLGTRNSVRIVMHVPGYPTTQRIPGSEFRYCVYGGFGTDPRESFLDKASMRLEVIELLEDDAMPTVIRRDEPWNRKADRNWHSREKVKAPWCDGKAWSGKLTFTDGRPVFAAMTPRVLRPKASGPSLDDDVGDGPSVTEILDGGS